MYYVKPFNYRLVGRLTEKPQKGERQEGVKLDNVRRGVMPTPRINFCRPSCASDDCFTQNGVIDKISISKLIYSIDRMQYEVHVVML